MIGLIYLCALILTIWIAFASYRKFVRNFDKKEGWGLNVIIFMMSAMAFSLFSFASSFALFSGQRIYVFSLVFNVLLISVVLLVIIGAVLRFFGGRWSVVGYGAHFGAGFLLPYVFILMGPLKLWLQVQTYY